ncbi:MAG TPA: hypothetical protein VJT75_07650 [Thermoleophilaceae bacterium]|nr:hypothetical protein [Thermoleophilaceae bacterium]
MIGAQAVDVVLPALHDSLAAAEARGSLRRLAGSLPPIDRGGFEVRLAEAASQVDVQQCVKPDDREPLLAHLRTAAGGDSPLARLAARWADPADAWHERIVELWLEWDRPSDAATPSLPAVFVTLPPERQRQAGARDVVDGVLALLLGGVPGSWTDNVARCFETPEPAIVSHVGLMLSRPGAPVRVNVKRLQRDTLVPYLEALGWPGDTSDLTAELEPLWAAADRVTTCLDIGSTIGPTLGLELAVDGLDRWRGLLDVLVDRGLCAPPKRSALLAWPGHDSPPSRGASWPDRLLVESLLRPADELGVVERRLSHVKVSLAPGVAARAKGYLWFGHRWLGFEPREPVTGARPPS